MHTDAHRFYAVLGVDPGVSGKAIHVAFRRRAKQLHPDAPAGDAEAFILLKRAYDTLSDPEQRAEYDRSCRPVPAEPRHRFTAPPPPMPSYRSHAGRRGSTGMARYVVAFIIMAVLSLGGVQVMIMLTEAPPSIKTRAPSQTAAAPASAETATETPAAPGSSKSGFWDPSPTSPNKN